MAWLFPILLFISLVVPQPTWSIELIQAKSLGYIDYTWQGNGNSTDMTLIIQNKIEKGLLVNIEVGTKLEPQSADIQTMVVTEKIDIVVSHHNWKAVKVAVAGLDITKSPPGKDDFMWSLSISPRLAEYITCVNRVMDEERRQLPFQDAAMVEELRQFIIQASLWRGYGATGNNWIDFFINSQGISEAEARKIREVVKDRFVDLSEKCLLIADKLER